MSKKNNTTSVKHESPGSYYHSLIHDISKETEKVIIGQKQMLHSIMCAMISRGHVLLEGVPGLAKSLTISTFSKVIGGDFQRIQFTPDKLPSDITGTTVYNEAVEKFEFYKGPIFCNFLLADEINRASPKLQSALLEAMQEKMVSIERKNYYLPELFMVLASQNPIEQMGTYPLSEAQLDRFMVKLDISYPAAEDENVLLKKKSTDYEDLKSSLRQIAEPAEVVDMQKYVAGTVIVSDAVLAYIQALCAKTRPDKHTSPEIINSYVAVGISPRGAEHLIYYCKSFAFIQGRNYVNFHDVDRCAPLVFGHKIVLNETARLEGTEAKELIGTIIDMTSPY